MRLAFEVTADSAHHSAAGALLMSASTVTVAVNAMTLHRVKPT